MINTQVAVVGAGLAGLIAARLLENAGLDYVVIEARSRFGGRVLTSNADGVGAHDGFDLGPSWYWPNKQPALAELVSELGLSSFGQNSHGDVIFERMSREGRHRLRGLNEEQQSMRLVGGWSAIIRALASHLPLEKAMLGTRVTAISMKDASVELTLQRRQDSSTALQAAHVIAALPPRLLEASVAFTPPIEEGTARLWRSTPTWMAPHAKFFAIYDHPFWRDAGLSGTAQSMVGPMVEMHDATTASGEAALFGFLGVSAQKRAELGREGVTHACVDQFTRIFGSQAAHPRATLFKDWAADPLTATKDDQAAGGHPPVAQSAWVSGQWSSMLKLAGSETSPEEAGFLAGALIAARRAVSETMASLKTAPHC